jgi:hypothetical protein
MMGGSAREESTVSKHIHKQTIEALEQRAREDYAGYFGSLLLVTTPKESPCA